MTSKMSLFAQIGTRSAPSSAHRLQVCPQINVLFTLDSTSLLTIIDGMKGLNCYARFRDDPGFEKLTNFIEVKASFLMPASLPFSQRGPFLPIAVAGTPPFLLYRKFNYQPATDFFSALFSRVRSRFRSSPRKQFLYQVAGCDSFLCRSHCARWPVPVLQLDGKNPYSGRPLSFSKSYTFYRAGCNHFNVPSSVSLFWQPAEGRYRDIH